MSEIEKAIMYWEEFKQEAIDMIAEGKYSNSVLEKQIPMCNTALDALREQAERSKGCVWCKSDSQVTHNGEHFCFFCSYCGKRLEVESIDAGTIGGEMVQRALKKLEVEP